MNKKIILMLSAVTLSGVAHAKQVQLPMVYEPMTTPKLTKVLQNGLPDTAACSFAVEQAEDLRPNKLSIGFNGSNLQAQKVTDWLHSAMVPFFDHAKREKAALQIAVQPKLTRLYTYHESMNILGVTSVKLDFKVKGEVVTSRHYRGFYAKTNWAAANGEYVTALNDAVNNMMPKVVQDLTQLCAHIAKSTG